MAKKKLAAATTPPPRHIGVQKYQFHAGSNTFIVYGQNIGSGAGAPKTVYLTANNHLWTSTTWSDIGNDTLQITSICSKKKHKPHHAEFGTYDGDDDLTVTITFDDGGGGPPDTIDCTFTDVEYAP